MKNDTEILIIESAAKVLLRENYQNMKTASIAKEAGIAEGTIYRYFKSKKDILVGVIRYYFDSIANSVFHGISPDNKLEENIGILLENYQSQLEEKISFIKLFYKSFSEIEDEGVKELLKQIYQDIIDRIKMIIKWAGSEIPLNEKDIEIVSAIISGMKDVLYQRHLLGYESNIGIVEIQKIKSVIISFFRK
jgi:TetR/AcrR family transcriptional regulator, fatty acid metabolism regulator protein